MCSVGVEAINSEGQWPSSSRTGHPWPTACYIKSIAYYNVSKWHYQCLKLNLNKMYHCALYLILIGTFWNLMKSLIRTPLTIGWFFRIWAKWRLLTWTELWRKWNSNRKTGTSYTILSALWISGCSRLWREKESWRFFRETKHFEPLKQTESGMKMF